MKADFISYINEHNKEGSQKAGSYIRALELLDDVLRRKAKDKLKGFNSIYDILSVETISQLYDYVLDEQKNKNGIFKDVKQNSYWRDGFFSAALNIYLDFLKQTINTKSNRPEKKSLKYSDQLLKFIKQARTGGLKTKHYQKNFSQITVKVSFGQGTPAHVPWISFLKDAFTTSDGIYPVYLYFKKQNILILAYGISETNEPSKNWNLYNPKTISEYFKENNLGTPYRYETSYVFKVYNVNNLPDADTLDNDLNKIINFYLDIDTPHPIEHTPQPKTIPQTELKPQTSKIQRSYFNLSSFNTACFNAGLIYSPHLTARFVASLATKPFVLLTGLSGSGKTKLAQVFTQWICESKEQYCIVPVGADWTNREPLLGYVNALDNRQYILPENGALELIIRANSDLDKPYFLILDEMNLSHVERYFADFLSVMESDDDLKLHSADENLNNNRHECFENAIEVPCQLKWPKNLFVIGTVNIDETTYMFSPKVLDRANVIEFRVSEDDLDKYLTVDNNQLDMSKLCEEDSTIGRGASYAENFVLIAKDKSAAKNLTTLNEELKKFFMELQKIGAEFGYRSASEIQILFKKLDAIDSNYSNKTDEKIDIAIMQKLLPKLHGSRSKLVPILSLLASLCYSRDFTVEETKKIFDDADNYSDNIVYPISLEKISRMYKNVIDNGFTSYAEA